MTLAFALTLAAAACAERPSRVLRFTEPAESFTESCPMGNGRLGAMVFGGVRSERVVLNEAGMWSGSPQDADRPDAAAALPEIRRLLLAGKNYEAEQLVNRSFTCAGEGSGRGRGKSVPYGSYQTLGDLRLEMDHSEGEATDYERTLHLATGQTSVAYTIAGVRHERLAFVSKPDEAIVLRLTASEPGAISFEAWLERGERARVVAVGDDSVEMFGQLEDGRDGHKGVRFSARLRVLSRGGEVTSRDGRLVVSGVDETTLLITAATDIDSFAGRKVDDARAASLRDLEAASRLSTDELASRQAEDHARYFDRVSLRLSDQASEPVATFFDFGRHLLVSSSRPGGFPANLQGIWAEELQTPWNGDWHANVNIQMNYWPAGPCGLIDLNEPLVALVESLVEPGRRTAAAYYDARGWVAHLLLNPWGYTSPGESASWGSTPTCSAWMCQHLWDHYLFTGDREFLASVYPTLRGAAAFYADMLVEEPEHDWLVTAPSNSPENAFRDAEGRTVHTCLGPAMDQQLLRYLFDSVVTAADVLGRDDPLLAELKEKRARLAPTQIGADGRVLEWLREREEVDPHHRHVSHLWGLYPGDEINRHDTPELAEAARRSLEARGDDGTGWAIAYKACLWARLGDGDRALRLLERLLEPVADGERRHHGGVYPNLFVAHPPFQIDGNFGATAAVAEMLVQSRLPDPEEAPEIELLPALPTEWAEGSVAGLQARGGVEASIDWSEGRLVRATLESVWAPEAVVRYRDQIRTVTLPLGEPVTVVFE